MADDDEKKKIVISILNCCAAKGPADIRTIRRKCAIAFVIENVANLIKFPIRFQLNHIKVTSKTNVVMNSRHQKAKRSHFCGAWMKLKRVDHLITRSVQKARTRSTLRNSLNSNGNHPGRCNVDTVVMSIAIVLKTMTENDTQAAHCTGEELVTEVRHAEVQHAIAHRDEALRAEARRDAVRCVQRMTGCHQDRTLDRPQEI